MDIGGWDNDVIGDSIFIGEADMVSVHKWRGCGSPVFTGGENNQRKYWIWGWVDDLKSGNLLWCLEIVRSAFFSVPAHTCYLCSRNDFLKMEKRKKDSICPIFTDWICRGTCMVKKYRSLNYKGSTVIEAAYLFPAIMLVWMLVLYALFYYHDKNIILGAAYETAVVGSEMAHESKHEIEGIISQYMKERVQGKLIFFPGVQVMVHKENNKVTVTALARAKWMHLSVVKSAAFTEPEKEIRKIRIIKQQLEDIKSE